MQPCVNLQQAAGGGGAALRCAVACGAVGPSTCAADAVEPLQRCRAQIQAPQRVTALLQRTVGALCARRAARPLGGAPPHAPARRGTRPGPINEGPPMWTRGTLAGTIAYTAP